MRVWCSGRSLRTYKRCVSITLKKCVCLFVVVCGVHVISRKCKPGLLLLMRRGDGLLAPFVWKVRPEGVVGQVPGDGRG